MLKHNLRHHHRTLHLEPLEARQLLAVDPIISEFLARNDDGLLDFEGDSSDWIELFNPGSEAVRLDGWFLTDNAAVDNKWALPPRTLGPGEFFVVFASGKDRYGEAPAFEDSHANFSLDGGGEYLALVHPASGTVASVFQPAYPEQLQDVSYGLFESTIVTDLITTGATAEVFIPGNNDLGTRWTRPNFSPGAGWLGGTTGVGFDVNDGGGQPAGELKIDFSQGTTTPLQAGWQGFGHGTDGGGSVTRSFASDELAGPGGSVNVTITGNVLSDVMVNIHLRDCRSVAITGNTLWKGYQHNLLIEGCSNVVIGPNCFDRNPRYGPHNGPVAHNSLIVRNSEDC
ncbi:MAG: lamin tail domain-containing protein, partial [Planctomycetes bacterium]|nr:lamin tail domain-containing protein [Planctomycetota bacterium]